MLCKHSWSGAYFKLTVEDVFRDSAILHATYVAEPSQATLAEDNIHAGSVCQLEHFCVGDVILPFDAKGAPEATYVKCVEAMLLLGISRPCLTAVQPDAEDTGLVPLNPSVQRECAVFPHPISQSGHGGRSFANAFVDLYINEQVVGDGRAQVGEILDNF